MKIGGQSFDRPKPVTIVLPHGDDNILLLAGSVVDYTEFNAMCPVPEPPKSLKPGQGEVQNFTDKTYLEQIQEHSRLRTYWMIKESLKETPLLEWENVVDDDPSTWNKIEEEMAGGFGTIGVSKILEKVLRANGLGQELVGEARESFLASQSQLQGG